MGGDDKDAAGRLAISLSSIHQLFNSLDPSPFFEKDLDANAEQYLISWARDLPKDARLQLVLHLREQPEGTAPQAWIQQAILRHFTERANLARSELQQLFRQGRISLVIGFAALVAFLFLGQALASSASSVLSGLVRESTLIAGWVAMWRPMQIYLYDWWPLRDRVALFERMSAMPVKLRTLAPQQPGT